MDMLPFSDGAPPKVSPPGQIPKELDIFYRSLEDFIPEGKTFDDLTPEEQTLVSNQYRFSPYRPGIYQGITGIGNKFPA